MWAEREQETNCWLPFDRWVNDVKKYRSRVNVIFASPF